MPSLSILNSAAANTAPSLVPFAIKERPNIRLERNRLLPILRIYSDILELVFILGVDHEHTIQKWQYTEGRQSRYGMNSPFSTHQTNSTQTYHRLSSSSRFLTSGNSRPHPTRKESNSIMRITLTEIFCFLITLRYANTKLTC
jgi:hypothetical protein